MGVSSNNGERVQALASLPLDDFTDVDYFCPELYSQPHALETISQSHGTQCHEPVVKGSYAPCFQSFESTYNPYSSNHEKMDRSSHNSNRPTLNSFIYQSTVPSANAIRQGPTQIQSSSYCAAQSLPSPALSQTMKPQYCIPAGVHQRDFALLPGSAPTAPHDSGRNPVTSMPSYYDPASTRSPVYGTPSSTVSSHATTGQNDSSPIAAQAPPQEQEDFTPGSFFDHGQSIGRGFFADYEYHAAQNPSRLSQATDDDGIDPPTVSLQALSNVKMQSTDTGHEKGQQNAMTSIDFDLDLPVWHNNLTPQTLTVPNSSYGNEGKARYNAGIAAVNNHGQTVYQQQPATQYGYDTDNDFDFNANPYANKGLYISNAMLGSNDFGQSDVASNTSGRGRQRARDTTMDQFLLKWKAEGMTYKEIKAKGGWDLEESTLRGRYRTLTKNKEERVRKPTWPQRSIDAMVDGVKHFMDAHRNKSTKLDLNKVPWKKVAEWMKKEKGCYLYGNATVKKKYQEYVLEEQLKEQTRGNQAYHYKDDYVI